MKGSLGPSRVKPYIKLVENAVLSASSFSLLGQDVGTTSVCP